MCGQDKQEDDFYAAVGRFLGARAPHYSHVFARLGEQRGQISFNPVAALGGPVWWAGRRMLGIALIVAAIELVGFGRLIFGLYGNLGNDLIARAAELAERGASRAELAAQARAEGAENADFLQQNADNMLMMAERLTEEGRQAAEQGMTIALTAFVFLLIAKLCQGFLADRILLARYTRWRNGQGGHSLWSLIAAGVVGLVFVAAVILVGFGQSLDANGGLTTFPAMQGLRGDISAAIDSGANTLTEQASWFFEGIRWGIATLLDAVEALFLTPPWPVIAVFILALTYLAAGSRTAIFAGAALAYLGLFGFWEASLRTVALLGTAAVIAIAFGIPIGVLCSRKPKFYAAIRPVLDFMQTMPAFVYLIPVIALFGIGKPPGVVATLFFGMPPVIRLTALGLQGVSQDAIEAARAFGASERTILLRVELPLARNSIMTGINQTIMMSLGMVVIASLIGAKGLGQDVLVSLQYAAIGQGILAGLAILCCAMLLDRVVQGRSKRVGRGDS